MTKDRTWTFPLPAAQAGAELLAGRSMPTNAPTWGRIRMGRRRRRPSLMRPRLGDHSLTHPPRQSAQTNHPRFSMQPPLASRARGALTPLARPRPVDSALCSTPTASSQIWRTRSSFVVPWESNKARSFLRTDQFEAHAPMVKGESSPLLDW